MSDTTSRRPPHRPRLAPDDPRRRRNLIKVYLTDDEMRAFNKLSNREQEGDSGTARRILMERAGRSE